MEQTLNPITEKDSMRYSQETSNFSNDIAWNQAFCQRTQLEKEH